MHTPAALGWSAFSGHLSELPFTKSCTAPYRVWVGAWMCVSGMKTTIDLQIIKMIV